MNGMRARTRALRPIVAVAVVGAVGVACSEAKPDTTYTRERLLDPKTCKECHADHYAEWSGSMHAYASKDPVFRAMNERGQRDVQLGPFCVNCHAPMAVRDEKTTDGLNLDELSDAYQGITCYFCHQVVKDVQDGGPEASTGAGSKGTHDNPLLIANDTTMRASVADPVHNKAHHSEYSLLHDGNGPESAKLCGSCHDIVVPAHFSGATADVELERTYKEWRESIFATTTPKACGDSGCHMRADKPTTIAAYPGVKSDRVFHHHRFPGVDVALTDFPEGNPAEKDEQRKEIDGLFRSMFTVQLCVSADGAIATVVLENVGVGHGIPSGAAQDRRLWVEFHGYGSKGDELFTHGVVPPGAPVPDPIEAGMTRNLFRDRTFDKDGNPAHFFWDVARIEPGAVNVPQTTDKLDPRYHKVNDIRRVQVATQHGAGALARITATVHVQPIGFDVIDALYGPAEGSDGGGASTDGAMVRAAMPTFDILPNKDSPVTVEWTYAASMHTSNVSSYGACFSTLEPPPG